MIGHVETLVDTLLGTLCAASLVSRESELTLPAWLSKSPSRSHTLRLGRYTYSYPHFRGAVVEQVSRKPVIFLNRRGKIPEEAEAFEEFEICIDTDTDHYVESNQQGVKATRSRGIKCIIRSRAMLSVLVSHSISSRTFRLLIYLCRYACEGAYIVVTDRYRGVAYAFLLLLLFLFAFFRCDVANVVDLTVGVSVCIEKTGPCRSVSFYLAVDVPFVEGMVSHHHGRDCRGWAVQGTGKRMWRMWRMWVWYRGKGSERLVWMRSGESVGFGACAIH